MQDIGDFNRPTMYLAPVMVVDAFVEIVARFQYVLKQDTHQAAAASINDFKDQLKKSIIQDISEVMHFRWILLGTRPKATLCTTGDGLCNYHSHRQVMFRFDHFKKTKDLLPVNKLRKFELPNNAFDCWEILNKEIENTIPLMTSPFTQRHLLQKLNNLHDVLLNLRGKMRPSFISDNSNIWVSTDQSGIMFMKDRPLLLFAFQEWANDLKYGNCFPGQLYYIKYCVTFIFILSSSVQ